LPLDSSTTGVSYSSPIIFILEKTPLLTTQHTQEGLSRAYVSAVAFKAGVNVLCNPFEFDYGVDGEFKELQIVENSDGKKKREHTGLTLGFQLKATIDWSHRGDKVIYDLEAPAYNKLSRQMNTYRVSKWGTPIVLIVMCLPKEEKEWLLMDEDQFLLKRCCYFSVIEGKETPNSASIRIEIPRTNRFSPDALKSLIRSIKMESFGK